MGIPKRRNDEKSPRWLIPVVAVVLLAVAGVIAARLVIDRPGTDTVATPAPVTADRSIPDVTVTPAPPTPATPTTSASPEMQGPPVGTAVGDTAPNFTLPDLSGESVSLSDYRGKVVILDFWASWCAPCRAAMPSLESLYESVKAEGVVMLGVSLDRTEGDAVNFLRSNGYGDLIALYGSLSAAQGVASRYGVYGIPHTFIIDRQGIIRFSNHPMRLTASLLQSIL